MIPSWRSNKIGYSFLIVSILLIASSWYFLSTPMLEWFVKKEIQKHLGHNLHIDNLSWNHGLILLEKPSLIKKKKSNTERQYFSAKKIVITYDFSLWNRSIHFGVNVDDPIININKTSEKLLKALLHSKPSKRKTFNVFWHLAVKQGIIKPKGKENTFFALDMSGGKSNAGKFSLNFKPSDNPKKQFVANFSSTPVGDRLMRLEFDRLPLSQAVNTFIPLSGLTRELTISSGEVEGFIQLSASKKNRPTFEAELILADLTATHRNLNLTSNISKATLRVPPKETSEKKGIIELHEQCYFSCGEAFRATDITGEATLNDQGTLSVKLESSCHYGNELCRFALKGDASLNFSDSLLEWSLTPYNFLFRLEKGNQPIQAKIANINHDQSTSRYQFECTNFGSQEFDLCKKFLGNKAPFLEGVFLSNGNIDANVFFDFHDDYMHHLDITAFNLNDADIQIPKIEFSGNFPSTNGALKVNLEHEDPTKTLKGFLLINEGSFSLGTQNLKKWDFQNVHADLRFHDGKMQNSTIEAIFAGMPSRIEISPHRDDQATFLHFQGYGLHLAKMLPTPLENGIQKELSFQPLSINTLIKPKQNALNLAANVAITNPFPQKDYLIDLNFDLIKNLTSPAPDLEIAGMLLANGHFSATELPLNKFVSPLLFERENFKLSGIANFQGSFEASSLAVEYQAKIMSLDNEALHMELSNHSLSQAKGKHFFDFVQNSNKGQLTISEATYFDKANSLPFHHVDASIHFDNQKIHAKQLTCTCYDLSLAGSIDMDYSYPESGRFDISVAINKIAGSVTSAQKLSSHFPAFKDLTQIPLQGNLSLTKETNRLFFAFYPDDYIFHTQLSGSLSEAALDCSARNFSLNDLSCDFAYDNQADTFKVSSLQGLLLLSDSDSDNAEEYTFKSNCHFTDLQNKKGKFEASFQKDNEELFHFTGHTSERLTPNQEKHFSIVLDKSQSHFLKALPTYAEMTLDQNLYINNFCIDLKGETKALIQNARSLGKVLPWQTFNSLKIDTALENASSPVNIALAYNQEENQFIFNIKGEQLNLYGTKIDKWLINGKKQGNVWSIEQLQADKLSIATDIVKEDQKWVFNFLGVRWGASLLAGLNGEYHADNHAFTGKLNLLELNLQETKEVPKLYELINKYHPKGTVKATGDLQISQIAESSHWKVNALINASIKEPQIMGITLKDLNKISVHYISDETLTIEDFEGDFAEQNRTKRPFIQKRPSPAHFKLQKARYVFGKGGYTINDLRFNIASDYLPFLTNTLKSHFPETFGSSAIEALKVCKRNDFLSGIINVVGDTELRNFQLQLANGKYWWFNSEYEIDNFLFEKEGVNLTTSFRYFIEKSSLWVLLQSISPTLSHGQLFLSDKRFLQDKKLRDIEANQTIAIDWTDTPHQGFAIQRAVGTVSGITINAIKDPKRAVSDKAIPLIGNASIQIDKAFNLLPQETREFLTQWQVRNNYAFTGQWLLSKIHTEENGLFSFQGVLNGQNIQLYGYGFQFLQADCSYSSKNIKLTNVTLKDPAGLLQIDRIDSIERAPGIWQVAVNNCEVSNYRPSMLKGTSPSIFDNHPALVIKQLHIQNLMGVVGNPYSFTATGFFDFDNHTRRPTHNPLFVIPSEIINRIGLDLSLLTPVSGIVNFDVSDRKIFFKRFKDLYSERKLSKFYLVNSAFPSYVDFDGNLNLHIRMKHDNLLFKLSELFTFNIKGTLQHPTYTLDKTPRRKS